MEGKKLAFIQKCEKSYGISTEEFIEWFETSMRETSEIENTWYEYAKSINSINAFQKEKK